MKINSENTNLNLRHLRAIHAIWAEGSFARAANRLGVVPSALSDAVRQIEEIIGVPLFDRRQRPPHPTPIGLEFLVETGPHLAALDRATERLRAAADLDRGRLRLGASPSAISSIVAPALLRFRTAHPAIEITLDDDIAERLAQKVSQGDLDLAIAGPGEVPGDLVQTELARDPFVLACRRDHPLARSGRAVQLCDIAPDSLIHLDEDTGTARLLRNHPALPADLRTGALHAKSTIAQLCLVRAGIGLALLPREAVRLFNDPDLGWVEIADLALSRVLYLLFPAHRPPSHVATHFAALLRSAP
ncbi:LysR family transcriptional regulator [Oceaniglobus ichthyenteri]|uniref:LysR family transcriptional regulator n=1 Tax=Oceaniglobus ichthyenteri TaxID=2136177 RepID=UPI000D36C631|nr:LysR family transcriptional regulator [Oceaniglobus ichthyenteri]